MAFSTMIEEGPPPYFLGRLASLPYFYGIATNPLVATTRLHRRHGRFVVLRYPAGRQSHSGILPCITDVDLYRSVSSSVETWRPANVAHRGIRGHASNRLAAGMTRMRGARLAHYRRLLMPFLSRRSVREKSGPLTEIAERHVASWPTEGVIDLLPLLGRLMQDFSVTLLFDDDRIDALPVAELVSRQWAAGWMPPGRDYFAWLFAADRQERAIQAWADKTRGALNPHHFLSTIVNTPDETGGQTRRDVIGGLMSFVFGAAFETSQSAAAWALLLLAQHPATARDLADEICGALRGGGADLNLIGELPLLSAVVKEAMRLFPPVPIHFRKSIAPTALGALSIEPGLRVLSNVYLINRDPDVYPQPARFIPTRWKGLDPSPYEYPVFGSGPRMCPGFSMGEDMVKLCVASVVSRYVITVDDDCRIDYTSKITLMPYPRLPVMLRKRDAAMPPVSRIAGRIHELLELAPG